MGFFPSDEALESLLQSCGLKDIADDIPFELFARSIALMIEEKN